jgi:hypothetical protein
MTTGAMTGKGEHTTYEVTKAQADRFDSPDRTSEIPYYQVRPLIPSLDHTDG